jgi:hypothetical protein
MENSKGKRKSSFANRPRNNLADISNKVFRDGDNSSRSRFEFSDSEFLESGIISRVQSPVCKSITCKNEFETMSDLSGVSESDQFLELTLQSSSLFISEKIRNSISSINLDLESTIAPKSKKSLSMSELPGYGFCSTTAYCQECAKDVHTILDYVTENTRGVFLKMMVKLMPFCEVPEWGKEHLVHRCSECLLIIGKGKL